MGDTLVLNADYTPLGVVNWQTAFCILYKENARVEVEYKDWTVRSGSSIHKVPAVIVKTEYVRFKPFVSFSRRNVYLRDGYECQYCGSKKELTFDHVIPSSKGGKTNWHNIVTCCRKCNSKKGNKTAKEVGLQLKRKPFEPSHREFVKYEVSKYKDRQEVWRDHVYWGSEI